MNVVVVDDNPASLDAFTTVLAHIHGVRTRGYESSWKALAACTAAPPDLIVLDDHMPAPDGMAFMKAYRKAPGCAETPILMVSGSGDRALRRHALMTGATDFVNKPADPIEFLARVCNLLATVASRGRADDRADALEAAASKAAADDDTRERETVASLMRAVELREDPGGMHVARMGRYAALLAERLVLPAETVRLIGAAVPMHDVGKALIPDAILLKREALTSEETDHMRYHAAAGYEMLVGGTSDLLKTAAEIALYHHERWNGEGYPHRLAGENIPLSARICAVADAFDNMLMARPYRAARTPDAAFFELNRLAGVAYDPAVVTATLAARDAFFAIANQSRDDGAMRASRRSASVSRVRTVSPALPAATRT